MNLFYGLLMAWGMFTIIPCPYRGWKEEARGYMLVSLPIIGLIIGAIWYGVFLILGRIPIYLKSICVAIVPWIITGFMHLDGFMDVCDAVMSRRDLETRQKILKDSRVGAFAVICIAILILLQTGSVLSLVEAEYTDNAIGLIFIPVVSRICAAFAVINLKPMKTSQYYELKTPKKFINVILILMLIVVMLTVTFSIQIAVALISTLTAYWICALYGNKMLGGMNGDISGYALTIAELVGIIGLVL